MVRWDHFRRDEALAIAAERWIGVGRRRLTRIIRRRLATDRLTAGKERRQEYESDFRRCRRERF
jgi:hypothetical protein